MSKKTIKQTAKKSVSKKKTGKTKSPKPVAKKNKPVKKTTPKKSKAQKQKPKAVKKTIPKKKIIVKKKITKPVPVKRKLVKSVPKKVKSKKVVHSKKITKPLAKRAERSEYMSAKKPLNKRIKAISVKKKKPKEHTKPSKVAVKKSISDKNLKPIFQPAKQTNFHAIRVENEIIDPLGKFEMEYTIHTSTPILFEFLTTPPGLSEWFCDDVNIRDGIYSFNWEGVAQKARLIKLIEDSVVRFQWVDKKDHTYFEFRIERDDLTNDISLIVVDFADTPEDRNSSTLLWNSQIEKLLHRLGSF